MAGPAKENADKAHKAARGVRLSAALRENLKRRKAQARGRGGGGSSGEAAAAEIKETAPAVGSGGETQAPDFRRNRGRE